MISKDTEEKLRKEWNKELGRDNFFTADSLKDFIDYAFDLFISKLSSALEEGAEAKYKEGFDAGLDSKYGRKMHERIFGAVRILERSRIKEGFKEIRSRDIYYKKDVLKAMSDMEKLISEGK